MSETEKEYNERLTRMGVDYRMFPYVSDDWITWPGKAQGRPKPPIIWADAAAVTDKSAIESAAYAPDPKEIVHIVYLAEDHYEVTTRNGKVFRIKSKQNPRLGMCIPCA